VLNDVPRWRVMPVGVSCLLHVGLVAGLVLGQQWVLTVVAVRPPVLPVQLVTLAGCGKTGLNREIHCRQGSK